VLRDLPGTKFEPTEGTIMPSHTQLLKMTVDGPVAGIAIGLIAIEGGSALGFEFSSTQSM
jgi:hypothetical protein